MKTMLLAFVVAWLTMPCALAQKDDIDDGVENFLDNSQRLTVVREAKNSKFAFPGHIKLLKEAMFGDSPEIRWHNESAIAKVIAANLAVDFVSLKQDAKLGKWIDLGYVIDLIATYRHHSHKELCKEAKKLRDKVTQLTRSASFNKSGTEGFHFDNLFTYDLIQQRWEELEKWAQQEVKQTQSSDRHWKVQGREDFLVLLGIVSHMVQDFYAHSNWVQICLRSNKQYAMPDYPIWDEIGLPARSKALARDYQFFFCRVIDSNQTVADDKDFDNEKSGLQTGRWPIGALSWWRGRIRFTDKKGNTKHPWGHRDEQHPLACELGARATKLWKDKLTGLLEPKYRENLYDYLGICAASVQQMPGASQQTTTVATEGSEEAIEETPTSTRRALAIGIRYDRLSHQEIPECEQDVRNFCQLLRRRYQFDNNDIVCLQSAQATKKGISDAFTAMIQCAQKGDTVVIYYSGHGTKVKDDKDNPDEQEDGLDEAIVTYDEDFIRDDELGKWVGEIANRGANVVVLFDSCFSGSGIRSFNLRASGHFASKYIDRPEWRQDAPQASKASTMDRILENKHEAKPSLGAERIAEIGKARAGKGSIVFFSACAESEASWTLKGKGQSAFTYHLLRAYENGLQGDLNRDGVMTFEEAYDFVRREVAGEPLPQRQNPTLEGNYRRSPTLYPAMYKKAAQQSKGCLPTVANPELKLHEMMENLILRQESIPTYAGWKMEIKLSPAHARFQTGDCLGLEVTTKQSGYLVVVNVTAKGEITLLFPNQKAQGNYVEKEQTVRIPPPGATWKIRVRNDDHEDSKEWMVAYLLENNPLQGYDIPNTFRSAAVIDCTVGAMPTLRHETLDRLLAVFCGKAYLAEEAVIEKWTNAAVGYTAAGN